MSLCHVWPETHSTNQASLELIKTPHPHPRFCLPSAKITGITTPSLISVFKTGFYCVAPTGLLFASLIKLIAVLLLQPSECQDYRHMGQLLYL